MTIPGYETFTTADGLILSNTMAVHVPVTEEGKREAKLMMPSNHLLNPGSKALTLAPSQESLIGLYLLTKEGKKTTKKYKDLIDARTAVRKGKILATDRVTIDGVKTTTGRYLVNEILPKDIRNYNVQIDKKVITGMLKSVVDRYKNKYNTIVNALHKLGNDHAYHAGFTVTMEDLKPVSARRDQILRSADKSLARFKETNKPTKAQLDRKSVEIYTKATEEMKQALAEVLRERENSLYQMATSGARGNLGQVRQIVMAPMLLVNTDGKTIPRPIKKSYVEGLSTAEMWIASYGARKGAVDKSRETSGPGELSKMLASSAMSNVISINDCGTHNGILVNVNDKDIFDRYAAADVVGIVKYNEIVTPSVVEKAKRKKTTQLPVRSPLKCEALEGTCAMCSGLDENGENYDIGTNIGIIAAQTLSEPAVQLVMKSTSGLISTADGIYPMSVFFDRSTNKIELEECDNANPVCNAIDKNGETETTITQRHKPHDDMYLVTTRSGACILAQGNHPMWVYDEQLRQGFSNRFTKLIGESEYSCTAAFPRSFTHKSTKKETIKTPRELSREDAIWVDYRPLKGGNVTPDVDPYVAGYFAAEGCFRVGNGTKKYDGIKVATIFSCHTNSAWFEKDVLGSILKVKHSVGQQAYTIYGLDYAKKLSMIVGYSSDHHRAHNKVLKVDIASLDPKWAQEFLEGYIDGDGCVFDRGNTTVAKTTSTSFELTCQIVAICHKLGLHCSVGTSDGAPCRKDVRTAFDVSIRFTKEYKPINSIKLVNIKPMQHKFGAICGYDPVQMVKKLNNWDGYVYDVKTETEGYMAGFIRNHNSFHTGGAAGEGSKIIGAFDRLKQIVEMPQNLVNKATLSSMTGKISDVKESSVGGFDVFVGNTKHHVRAGYDLKVKTGDQVKMGDQLSSGVIKPQELLEYKGMDAVQSYLKNELYDLYSDDGPIRKSIIEQMIRAITSLTQIDDPLDTNYIAGDIVPIRKIEALNKGAAKNSKILHTPILKGVNMLPTALSSYEDADWAGRMGYTHLLKTMSEGASQGWSTDIHGYHPIPGLMYASEFGKSEKGKY